MSIFELSDTDFFAVATPIVEGSQTGWSENIYEKFSEYFSNEMMGKVDIGNYKSQRERIFPQLGKHKNVEAVSIHKNPTNVIGTWKLYVEKREEPALLIYNFIELSGGLQVNGALLYF